LKASARDRLDGVLLLDKPVGPSSAQALGRARWLLAAAKAGHGGTLDPLASGVLPVLLGEATKFSHDLLEADKTYEACVRLGITTSTADGEGAVLARVGLLWEDGQRIEHGEALPLVPLSTALVHEACAAFCGRIVQVPPMHSALKKDGRPLYEYARAGLTVDVPTREVTIHAIEVLRIELGQQNASPPNLESIQPAALDVWIRVDCSKGTYIRTLAADIGARLGCGAYLAGLRRTQVGDLKIEQSISLEALEALPDRVARRACLAPVDSLLGSLPRLALAAEEAERFCHGQPIDLSATVMAGDTRLQSESTTIPRLRIYCGERLLGLAQAQGRVLKPLRLLATN